MTLIKNQSLNTNRFFKEIKKKGDRFIEVSLWIYFLFGVLIAGEYDTYLIGVMVGSLCLTAYYITKFLLPNLGVHRYVAASSFAIFMAQFIYQMHGMFEMHFFAFVGCTILIAYQNWKLQIPLLLIIALHHGGFAYLQFSGIEEVYFTQLSYMDLKTFLLHVVLAAVIVGVCAYWSVQNAKKTIEDGIRSEDLAIKLNHNLVIAQMVSDGKFEEASQKNLELNDELSDQLQLMAQNIEDQQKRLTNKNDDMRTLVYSMSHDMITPIRGINTISEWIDSDISEKNYNNLKEYASKLKANAHSMWDKTESLKNYLKIDIEETNVSTINLNKLLDEVVKKLHLEHKFGFVCDSLPEINGNLRNYNQLFFHLIENGIVHNQNDYPTISLQVVSINNSLLKIKYSDNGPGISKNDFKRYSKIFQTGGKEYSDLRSGFGLPLILKIIDSEKAKIEYLESEIGLSLSIQIKL